MKTTRETKSLEILERIVNGCTITGVVCRLPNRFMAVLGSIYSYSIAVTEEKGGILQKYRAKISKWAKLVHLGESKESSQTQKRSLCGCDDPLSSNAIVVVGASAG